MANESKHRMPNPPASWVSRRDIGIALADLFAAQRVVTVSGRPRAGKTAWVCHELQQRNVVYLDLESSKNPVEALFGALHSSAMVYDEEGAFAQVIDAAEAESSIVVVDHPSEEFADLLGLFVTFARKFARFSRWVFVVPAGGDVEIPEPETPFSEAALRPKVSRIQQLANMPIHDALLAVEREMADLVRSGLSMSVWRLLSSAPESQQRERLKSRLAYLTKSRAWAAAVEPQKPETLPEHIIEAELAFLRGHPDVAQQVLERCFKREPTVDIATLLVSFYYINGNTPVARQMLDRAEGQTERERFRLAALRHVLDALHGEGDVDALAETFERGLEVEILDRPALLALSRAFYFHHQMRRALHALERAELSDPIETTFYSSWATRFEGALIGFCAGDVARARTFVEQAIWGDENPPYPLLALAAAVHANDGNDALAVEFFRRSANLAAKGKDRPYEDAIRSSHRDFAQYAVSPRVEEPHLRESNDMRRELVVGWRAISNLEPMQSADERVALLCGALENDSAAWLKIDRRLTANEQAQDARALISFGFKTALLALHHGRADALQRWTRYQTWCERFQRIARYEDASVVSALFSTEWDPRELWKIYQTSRRFAQRIVGTALGFSTEASLLEQSVVSRFVSRTFAPKKAELQTDGVSIWSRDQWVSLQRTPTLAALIGALCEGPKSKDDLLRQVWGVDDPHPFKHENRLRMAVFKIRKQTSEFGLDVIQTTEDGYRLSDAIGVVDWSSADAK